ncbi:hydroxyethylthiazole kinase [candidate division KSB1 bacterium]|nr:hydroxyethylthiazole kinase [candidate division KSB1 bacterium]
MEIKKTLDLIDKKKPLIHHITNWVTIYDCANITRAVGALPIMAHAPEEVAEMTGISSALVLNIGTLTTELIKSMKIAGKKANKSGAAIVLDAVGAGATKLRTEKCKELLAALDINIIKGNAGEIATLAGIEAEVKGVESVSVSGDIRVIAADFARERGAVIVVSGKQDIVTDGRTTYFIDNGHEMMGQVVGTGCMLASVIGSFAAVNKDYNLAAAQAVTYYDIAGELAAEKSDGPGTFREQFFDQIYLNRHTDFTERQKVVVYEN